MQPSAVTWGAAAVKTFQPILCFDFWMPLTKFKFKEFEQKNLVQHQLALSSLSLCHPSSLLFIPHRSSTDPTIAWQSHSWPVFLRCLHKYHSHTSLLFILVLTIRSNNSDHLAFLRLQSLAFARLEWSVIVIPLGVVPPTRTLAL